MSGRSEMLLSAEIAGDCHAYAKPLLTVAPILRGVVIARGGKLSEAEREDAFEDVRLAVRLKRHP